MERLKVAIADKILEISSGNPEEMKYRLAKIQRFNDFAEACKTLMTKYPDIETELLEMVADDDFDASRASRRVDSVINREQKMPEPILGYQTNQIPEVIPIITPPPADIIEDDISEPEEIEIFEETVEEFEEQTPAEEPLFTEEVTTEPQSEFDPPVIAEISEPENEVVFSTVPEESTEDIDKKAKRKKQLTLIWKILAVIVSIVVIIFVVKFVMSYWKTILIVLASLLVIAALGLYLKRRNKNKVN